MPDEPNLPPLSDDAAKHAGIISTFLHERLKAIAQQLAKANGCEFTLKPDVNLALKALKEAGLDEPPPPRQWYRRSSFQVGCGTLIAGLSLGVAGFAKDIIEKPYAEHPYQYWIFVILLPFALLTIGLMLAVAGWVRDDA